MKLLPFFAGAALVGSSFIFPNAVEAYPRPQYGSCRYGYSSEGDFCVPNDASQVQTGSYYPRPQYGSCRYGWQSEGDYCVK